MNNLKQNEMTKIRFRKENISIQNIGRQRFWIGIVAGLISAISISLFFNHSRESLRLLTSMSADLLILKDNEVKEGYSREDRPLGLQHLYEKFTRLKSDLIKSKTSIVNVTKLSFITIILSLFILTLVDFIKNNLVFEISLIFIILLMSIFSIYETYKGIKLGIE